MVFVAYMQYGRRSRDLVCAYGVKQAREWCEMPLVVEGDCLMLIAGLKDSSRDKSRFGLILQEIKLLCNNLMDVVFSKINRESNRVAHELAQLAKRGVEAAVLRLEAPPCIDDLLVKDCNGLI